MSDPTGPAVSAMPSQRLWAAALIVSLCLNFVMIGLLAAMFWRWPFPARNFAPPPGIDLGAGDIGRSHGHGPGMGHGMGLGLGQGPLNPHMLEHIAPAKADAIRAVILAHRKPLADLRDASFAARDAAAKVLAADGATQADIGAAFGKVREADAALETEVLKTVAECAALLTPEERRAALEERMKNGGGHGGFGRFHGGGGR
jgi:uncharacterized membrane protein